MQIHDVMQLDERKEMKEKRMNKMKSLNSLVDAAHDIQRATVECSSIDQELNIRKAKKASKTEKSEKKESKHKKRKKRHKGESISQHKTAESGELVSDVQEFKLPTSLEAETPENIHDGVCHDVHDLKSFDDDQLPESEFQRQQFEVYRRLNALSVKAMSNKKMSRDLQMSQGELSSTEFSIVSDITSDSHPIDFYGMKSNAYSSKIIAKKSPSHLSTTMNNTKSMHKAAIIEDYEYDQAESQICYTEDQGSHCGNDPSLSHEKWETLDEDADEAICNFIIDSNHDLEQSTKLSCGIVDSQKRIHDKSHLITYLKSVGVSSTVARRIADDFENDPGMKAMHRNVRETTEYSQSTGATDTEMIFEDTPAIRKMRETMSTSQMTRRQTESNLTRRSNRPRSSLNWVRYSNPGVVQVDSRAFGAPYRHQDTIMELEGNARYDEKPLEAELVEAKIFTAHHMDIDEDKEAAILYVESEPLSFKSLMKERSFCLIFTLGISLILITLITLSVTLSKSSGEFLTPTEEPSFSPTSQPTRIDDDFFDAVAIVSGMEPLLNEGSPQRKALSWMSSIDEARLKPNDFSFLQRYSLIVIYYATGGEKFWTEKESWLNKSMHECDWGLSTIECVQNAADRRSVIALDLSRHGLNGKIPLEIGLLTSATAIKLSKNGLRGTIPTTIFAIPSLSRLEINGNSITGIIPSELSLARGLSYLDMSYNEINSSLPSAVYMLTNLFWLDLSVNKLTGSLASDIGKLSLLTSINLRHNLIGGTIPNAFDNIPKLDFILLGKCHILTIFLDFDTHLTYCFWYRRQFIDRHITSIFRAICDKTGDDNIE
jgi:Leucine rich repeat